MVRPIIMGLGAAGALSAAAVTGVSLTRTDKPIEAARVSLANAAGETVCIKSNVRLVEGMSAACYARAQYEAMRDRAVIAADGSPVRVALAHPTDASIPAETASNCAEYDSLIAEGWAALSSADMRREEYFRRACGALGFLAAARPARVSHFANGRASAENVRSMATADAVGFGETDPSATVDVAAVEDGVWKVTIGGGETMIYEIAHADFNRDGAGEILAYVSVGAAGGTARSGSIGFMEVPTAGAPCSFSAR
ncbi:MAG: hypothetical protein U5J99_02420 [Parvularculaceae bacterium]|nr:hypothetical protein [Parvularculaceae bacterium]